jgi:hypothetical protein
MAARKPLSIRRYFSGLAEDTFQIHLGVADPQLVDYISDLLVRFIRCEKLFRMKSLAGKRLHEVVDMMWEAEERLGDAKREAHRHIGDFALFWTGVYPEAIRTISKTSCKDQLVDYQSEGKRAYWIASTIESSEEEVAPCAVLERLSQQFELCAYGLREVRRQWEEGDGEEQVRPFLI